jgi:hypothetical protein
MIPKLMLNYRPNGRRRLGRPLKRLLDEAETGLSWPNSWRMMMMLVTIPSQHFMSVTRSHIACFIQRTVSNCVEEEAWMLQLVRYLGYGLDDLGFSSRVTVEPTPPPIRLLLRVLCPRGETDHLSPSSVEVKHKRSYTSIPACVFWACRRKTILLCSRGDERMIIICRVV